MIERPIRSRRLAAVAVALPALAALAALAALVALVAACGGAPVVASPTATAASPSTAPSTAPSAASPSPTAVAASPSTTAGLLLEVTSEGGFINPAASIGAVPQVVVDTDGRIFLPAPALDGSQPLVPAVAVRDTGPGGAAAILAAIRAAGLDTEGSGGIAADTGSTVFTAVIDGETIVSRFAAGGPMGPGGPGGPGASTPPDASGPPAAPGAAAFALLARLTDPGETWGAAAPPPTRPYIPDAYLLYLAPADAATTTDPAWPLSTPPEAFGAPAVPDRGVAGLRSGIVTGTDARTLAATLATAQAGSVVRSGGSAWSVWVRPVFPDETSG